MRDLREDTLIVLYDDDCGFCEVMLAMLLTWDRASRVRPVPIQSTPEGRFSSTWSVKIV